MSNAHRSSKRKREARLPQQRVATVGRLSYDIDCWDEKGIDEEARTFLLHGQHYEACGALEQALRFYECALATPESRRHPVDTGTMFHQVGVCASRLGDGRRAWDAFMAAACVYIEDEGAESVSDSLSEAGLLRVMVPSELPIETRVDARLVAAGFDEAIDKVRRALLGDAPPTYAAAMPSHRKITGMMVLAAHARLDNELLRASKILSQHVVKPFAERHYVRQKSPVDEILKTFAAFDALNCLCSAIADAERLVQAGAVLSRGEVSVLARFTTSAFSGKPCVLMLHWLGTYLRECHSASWVTDEHLMPPGTR